MASNLSGEQLNPESQHGGHNVDTSWLKSHYRHKYDADKWMHTLNIVHCATPSKGRVWVGAVLSCLRPMGGEHRWIVGEKWTAVQVDRNKVAGLKIAPGCIFLPPRSDFTAGVVSLCRRPLTLYVCFSDQTFDLLICSSSFTLYFSITLNEKPPLYKHYVNGYLWFMLSWSNEGLSDADYWYWHKTTKTSMGGDNLFNHRLPRVSHTTRRHHKQVFGIQRQ